MTIVDDVLPAEIAEPAVPVPLDRLLPWHQPRKQLVREEQWLRLSRRLIKEESSRLGSSAQGDGQPEIRYLTLPGIDYIDVRQLADVCLEYNCCLTSTGFHAGDERKPHVARAKFRETSLIDAGRITRRSYTYAQRFEDISETGSNAYRDLKQRGPFHIVNVDACGSLAPPTAKHARRLVEAVFRVVELQFQKTTDRWLLFITTDARPESVSGETLQRLCQTIFKNADENDSFRGVAARLLDPGAADVRAAVESATEQTGLAFLKLFSLGLAKWLLHLAHGTKREMRTHKSYCYSTTRRDDRRPSMACLAFEFLPPPPGLEDRFRVSRARPTRNPQLGNTSLRAAEKIRDMTDVDKLMGDDGALRQRMTRSLRAQGSPHFSLEVNRPSPFLDRRFFPCKTLQNVARPGTILTHVHASETVKGRCPTDRETRSHELHNHVV